MSLQIEFDWEDPQAAKGPELRATWARLLILINDVPITQVQDYSARSVRDGIYVPLYPLAEWLAMHWWSLFHEYENPHLQRDVSGSYPMRHNLRYAREGFALPDLDIRPMGRTVFFEWKVADMPARKVRFLQEGTAHIETSVVYEALANFITAVVRRLESFDVSNTPLKDEWKAIEEADLEEQTFCEAVAALGLDPYSLPDAERETIVQVSEKLPKELMADFFATANSRHLSTQLARLLDGVNRIKALPGDLTPLRDLQKDTQKIDVLYTPWEQGYAFARELRKQLGIEDRLIGDMHDFSACLGVETQALQQVILSTDATNGHARFFDALVDVNEKGSPGFLIEKRQEEARKFALCRGLFEYLTSDTGASALLSTTRSERQKRNRAFAAEFLAPAALLKEHLRGETLAEEEVDDVAEVFGVSSYVIRHQIDNHHLARLTMS